jgi:hypothetical protein
MRGVPVALAAGLGLLAVALALTLLHSPASVAGTNRPLGQPEQPIASTTRSTGYCQAGEVLPQGTSAIRVWLDAAYGPRMSLTVSAGGHALTRGERGSGWTGGSVTIPVKPLARTVADADVCVSFHLKDETIIMQGNDASPASAAHEGPRALSGRFWIEYLRPGTRSWASLVASTMQRMGLGRAFAGTWIAFVALALLALLGVLASMLVVEELR